MTTVIDGQGARTRTGPQRRGLSPGTSPSTTYRTDLDGLRGVAIMLVACFHVWFGRVSGGVDVFLTLSGYFFLGSLLNHAIRAPRSRATLWQIVNPRERLTRLIRRLLPALLTVLGGVMVLTIAIFPSTRWVTVGSETIASALYYQNWHLAWNSQDYTAASSANSPLQHLWSMSVQGQFFIVTMIVGLLAAAAITVAARRIPAIGEPRTIRAIVAFALIAVAAVSFYHAYRLQSINQPYNYYDTISRVWEPLFGGLLAVWTPPRLRSTWVRTAAAAAALALIVTCGWWIDGVGQYPGPMALVPVLATLAIIWAGAQRPDGASAPSLVNIGLASRIPVWLGSVSYALYLWHWPLLIFYLTWRGINHASVLEGIGILAVSTALAAGTKRFVEDPLRGTRTVARHAKQARVDSRGFRRSVTAILTTAVIAGGAGIVTWQHHIDTISVDTSALNPAVYPGARAFLQKAATPRVAAVPSPLEVIKDLPATSWDGKIANFHDPNITVGIYGDPNATHTIALAGGSHAEHWMTALDALGKRNHFKVTTYLKMGCPLSTDPHVTLNGAPYPQCVDWVGRVMARIIADKPDAVFTNSTRPRYRGLFDEWVPPDYLTIFGQFRDAGIPVLGIRDTPWPHNNRGAIDTPTCLANGGDATSCGTTRATSFPGANPTNAIVARYPNVHPLDMTAGMCNATLCPAVVGNIVVYHDWHHLSATFVRSLTDEMGRQMRAVFDWA